MRTIEGGAPAGGATRSGVRPQDRSHPAATLTRPLRRVRPARQLVIVLTAVTIYFGVRGATEGAVSLAVRNAGEVVRAERLLGIAVERTLQSMIAGSESLVQIMNWVYIWGHWPVIAITLVWLAKQHPQIYYRTRDAMIASGVVGLIVFVTFPVAPPRLVDRLGMIDTITENSRSYRVLQPPSFTNQYAAMPSLHVGWDLLMGLAMIATTQHLLMRALGAAMPLAMTAAVVLTANHYLVDALAGAALTTASWILTGRARRRPASEAAAAIRTPQTVTRVPTGSGAPVRRARWRDRVPALDRPDQDLRP